MSIIGEKNPRTAATNDCMIVAIIHDVFSKRGNLAADALDNILDADTCVFYSFRPLRELLQIPQESVTGCIVVHD